MCRDEQHGSSSATTEKGALIGHVMRFLIAFLLLCGAACANMVQAPPPQVGGPQPPPQAAAAGYTTLATNQDFRGTTGVDINCKPGSLDEPGHFWYTTFNGLLGQPFGCEHIFWPATDPATGTGALKVSWTTTDWGFQQSRVGLASSNNDSSSAHTFPMKAYYEAEVRFANNGYMGGWYSNWMWRTHDGSGSIIEADVEETHAIANGPSGVARNFVGAAGALNWGNGFTQNNTNGSTSGYFDYLNYDANIYHKWGELITTPDPSTCVFSPRTMPPNGSPCFRVCAFLDDVQLGCGNTPIVGDEAAQRNVIMINVTVSCGNNGNGDYGQEGAPNCMDLPISGVASNGAGGTRVTVSWSIQGCCGAANNASIKIVETNTSADGINVWSFVDDTSTASHFDIPVPFSGTYSGAGRVNPTPIIQYVRTWRVWSCSSWATTQC